ncbi:MAG TPA: hypothetical protein VFW65_40465 [Pseudonocardiaceae bacterium]|nr:hypothetical protein [Pseudonocardiaceae bacterium]
MASMTDRISAALRSREGRKLAERAKQIARDPATRRTLTDLRRRFGKKSR